MAGLASSITKAVRAKSKLDSFREGLASLGQPAAPGPVVQAKPLPVAPPGPAVVTNVAAPYGSAPSPMSPRDRLAGAQDRMMGILGGLASRSGMRSPNALIGRGPINALMMGWRGR